jgi:hypothetical protein
MCTRENAATATGGCCSSECLVVAAMLHKLHAILAQLLLLSLTTSFNLCCFNCCSELFAMLRQLCSSCMHSPAAMACCPAHLILAQHAALVPADCVVVHVDLPQAAHHVQLVVGAAVAIILGTLSTAAAAAGTEVSKLQK